jgi:hypothetical protein
MRLNERLIQVLYHALGIFLALAAAILLVAGFKAATDQDGGRDGYYAVTLTSGQVYFGRLTRNGRDRVVLEHVFYPKLQGALSNTTETTDAQLVKFGTEIYAPEDRMEIMKENILTIAKVRDDGKLAEAIKSYKQE